VPSIPSEEHAGVPHNGDGPTGSLPDDEPPVLTEEIHRESRGGAGVHGGVDMSSGSGSDKGGPKMSGEESSFEPGDSLDR
jgi:hypothetical protein